MPYAVELEAFHGPLDLLLHLVKKNEVDVLDIPIATITEQFLAYLQVMQELDMDLAGDFVVMAATLMEIKSRMLIAHEAVEVEEDGDDPRRELVAKNAGALVMEILRAGGPLPRDLITRKSLENACAIVAATSAPSTVSNRSSKTLPLSRTTPLSFWYL